VPDGVSKCKSPDLGRLQADEFHSYAPSKPRPELVSDRESAASTSFSTGYGAESASPSKDAHSGVSMPSCAIDSKRVDRFKNARRNLPVGPFRCLAMMSSATPSSSGSSGL